MSSETITHVVVPGTFDPVTLGHVDVIRRARRLFPRVTVAVAASVNKHGRGTAFTLEERADMIREAISLEGMPADIEVMPFTGLLVDFCKELGAGGVDDVCNLFIEVVAESGNAQGGAARVEQLALSFVGHGAPPS